MFERNPVDNRKETLLAIEITLANGEIVAGRSVLASGKSPNRLLEGGEGLLYVEQFDGGGVFVPKKEIRGLRVFDARRPSPAMLRVPDASDFDPYRVLGLDKGASFDEIHAAYVAKSKLYHPDRYASVELPGEVRVYIEASAKAVNVAFQALKHVRHKSDTIYRRGG